MKAMKFECYIYICFVYSMSKADLSYNVVLLFDWRDSCFMIGSICLKTSLCLPENRSKLAYTFKLHENQLKLVSRS